MKEGCVEGSIVANDYLWDYTEKEIEMYILNAEIFYHLYCHRYVSYNLTPYMIKFFDLSLYFLNISRYPSVVLWQKVGYM